MNKMVKCPGCNEGYNLDLDKYGGKKIKCKKCQGIIAVPTAAEAQDEFEVVEETASSPSPTPLARLPTPPAPLPTGVPPSIFQRNRMASQRGAVNIALLQRNEASREAIRLAFLDVHGSKGSRLPDSIVPILEALEKNEEMVENDQFAVMIAKFKQTLARAHSVDSGLLKVNFQALIAPQKFTDVSKVPFVSLSQECVAAEEAYTEAISILGEPVRLVEPVMEKPKEKPSFWGVIKASLDGGALEEERLKAELVRKGKMATIQAAIEVLENTHHRLAAENAVLNREYEKVIAEHTQRSGAALGRARGQLQEGKLSEATLALQELLKAAPVELLGQVLIALGQCTYLSGNASNAARHIQDAICFGASAPVNMDEGYNDLWAKSSAGLPKT